MTDILGKIFSYILMTFALLLAIMSLLTGVDRIMDSYVTNKATSFVDICRTTGKIDPDNYEEFCKSIYKIGDYEVELCHGKRIALWSNGESQLMHKEFYSEEILDKMYGQNDTENYPYLLNNGDYITISVRKMGKGFSGGFYEFFLNNGNSSKLLVNYSGIVGSNGMAIN